MRRTAPLFRPAADRSVGPRKTVVIVGAGFGGLAAARALARSAVDVVLIDRTNHHLFQPLLYQVATAALSPADIAVAVRSQLRRQKNATLLMAEVEGVDAVRKVVRLKGGATRGFDWLILATGADYSFFGHPEWARHALVLKTLDAATASRRNLLQAFERAELAAGEAGSRAPVFGVVGGGPTGVEMAGAIAEMARTSLAGDFRRIDPAAARILLFEAGPRLLPALPALLSDYGRRALDRLGVEVVTGVAVDAIEVGSLTAGGRRYEMDAVLWCAGVQARPAAAWLGITPARGGATPVRPDCSVPGWPGVFAIGDVAAFERGGSRLPGLAPVARQQGRYVAQVIQAFMRERPPPGPFAYTDWGSMAVIGRSRAIATFGRTRLKGFLAWLTWSLVHLMLLIDFRSRASVYLNWTWAWFTRGRAARLITRA
jgi:NADH dehydrogenase